MPPKSKTIQDIYNQLELDRLYAGKSSGEGSSIVEAMQAQRRLESMPQSGAVQSLTPIGPIDLAAETGLTALGSMDNVNPLVVMLAGVLAPGAYKNIKTRNTPALLKKFDIKVDSPVYHNTTIDNAAGILKKNRIGAENPGEWVYKDKRGHSVSVTRDPEYSLVPGLGSSDLDIQLVLDKKGISKMRGTTISPYAHGQSSRKSAFRKGQPKFEAEERVYNKVGIPTGHIKAIKLRGLPSRINDESLLSLIKKSTKKKIPIMVEPGSENTVRGLLDVLDPKQKSKALKNIKFTRSGGSDTKFKKLSGSNNEYEAVIDGKKYTVYKERGDFYADDVGFLGNSLDEVTDFIKSGDFDEAVQYNRM